MITATKEKSSFDRMLLSLRDRPPMRPSSYGLKGYCAREEEPAGGAAGTAGRLPCPDAALIVAGIVSSTLTAKEAGS